MVNHVVSLFHIGVYVKGILYPLIYLFILCSEGLIANIKKVERGKQLTGMKVARACPSICHLLFLRMIASSFVKLKEKSVKQFSES